jgi:hypothetical protein
LNPNLDVCMTASLTCPRHKYPCVMSSSSRLDRRADLAGRPSYGVHPTISMTLRSSVLWRTSDNQHDTNWLSIYDDHPLVLLKLSFGFGHCCKYIPSLVLVVHMCESVPTNTYLISTLYNCSRDQMFVHARPSFVIRDKTSYSDLSVCMYQQYH